MRSYKKIMKSKRKSSLSALLTDHIEPKQKEALHASLHINIQRVRDALGNSDDIIIREIRIGVEGKLNAGILYTDGLADSKSIQEFIMESLMVDMQKIEWEKKVSLEQNYLEVLKDYVLTVGDIQDVSDFKDLCFFLLSGKVIFLVDGYPHGYSIGMSGWEDRGVTEATTESVVRGPKESFSENLRTNTALIRRKIKDNNLWLETRKIGMVTKTSVSIMYINGIANDKIVDEVRARLDRIDIDGILEGGYIEELIQDDTFTPFPTIFNTERPDVVAGDLLEGKIAILVDGSPFVLIVPALLIQFFQSAEDYYHRADFSSLIRVFRLLSFLIALIGPSLYVAISTFHQEMLPTGLLISLAAQREGVPFPAFIEALLMEVAFEILREAGIRMPRAVGPAMSIVGTLVIGQAAVDAGIVSAAMVIVVSITAISSFVFPSSSMSISIRLIRFPLMILAATFGLFGITVGLIALVLHLCSLRSFGVPYLTPFAPFNFEDQKDTIFRFPHWGMFTRPRLVSQKNVARQQDPTHAKPGPYKDHE